MYVVVDEIGEEVHVAALFGDPLGAFLAETGGQILLDRLDLALAFLAPQRNPVGDWPAPGREIFNDRMAVSKIVAEPGETRVVRRAIGVLQIFEIRSEEHTSELQSLMRISSDVFSLKIKIY